MGNDDPPPCIDVVYRPDDASNNLPSHTSTATTAIPQLLRIRLRHLGVVDAVTRVMRPLCPRGRTASLANSRDARSLCSNANLPVSRLAPGISQVTLNRFDVLRYTGRSALHIDVSPSSDKPSQRLPSSTPGNRCVVGAHALKLEIQRMVHVCGPLAQFAQLGLAVPYWVEAAARHRATGSCPTTCNKH